MKLRNPRLIRLASWAGAGVIRVWMRTLRLKSDSRGQWTDPWDPNLRERFIYALWHENMAVTFRVSTAAPMKILMSQSADGELLSQLSERCGVPTIRGSSSHGAVEALDQLVSLAATHHILVAPDGPRGPRREIKRGLAYLASRTGMRVVPFGVGFSSCWRAKSWDRTAIPKPGSTLTCVAGPIVAVPPNAGKKALDHYRLQIQQSLDAANAAAQDWAAGQPQDVRWPDVGSQAA
jgi:lysophospholipid acyltransferase (LPLAT)-like uncharacterized protein